MKKNIQSDERLTQSKKHHFINGLYIKLLSVLLAFLLIFTMCPMRAFATNDAIGAVSDSNTSLVQENVASQAKLGSILPKIDNNLLNAVMYNLGLWDGNPSIIMWLAGNFLSNIILPLLYPSDESTVSPEMEMLEEVIAKENEILSSVCSIRTSLSELSYNEIINKFNGNFESGYYINNIGGALKYFEDVKYKVYLIV